MTTHKHYALNKYLCRKGGEPHGQTSQPHPQPTPTQTQARPTPGANPVPPKETVDKKGG